MFGNVLRDVLDSLGMCCEIPWSESLCLSDCGDLHIHLRERVEI